MSLIAAALYERRPAVVDRRYSSATLVVAPGSYKGRPYA